MEIFYHGSHNLFDSFDLSHALEGDGKVKFGYGVYVTSRYSSAAHYSGSNPQSNDHYVYTVEVPDKTEGNCIAFKQPVPSAIAESAQNRLGELIPAKVLPLLLTTRMVKYSSVVVQLQVKPTIVLLPREMANL